MMPTSSTNAFYFFSNRWLVWISVFLLTSVTRVSGQNRNEPSPSGFYGAMHDKGMPAGAISTLQKQNQILQESGRKLTISSTFKTTAAGNQVNACGTCHDMGAENGWDVWQAEAGRNFDSAGLSLTNLAAPVAPRFNITTGPGVDPLTPGLNPGDPPITLVAPPGFGSSSIQLGEPMNDGDGGGCSQMGAAAGCVERLTYCFTVGLLDTNFLYAYAFVMENPDTSHAYEDMPYVEFMMLDANGDTLPCALQHYVASVDLAGQYTCNSRRWWGGGGGGGGGGNNQGWPTYKPWTVVGVNLSSYIGQTLTVVITNSDCTQGGHFAHSYWDFACGNSAAVIKPNCYANAPDTLTAPSPPDTLNTYSYEWYQNGSATIIGTTQTITPYAQPGDTFTVKVISQTGCDWYVRYVPQHFTVTADFDFVTHCGFASFTDASFSPSTDDPIGFWSWDFGLGNARDTAVPNPTPVYFPPGDHTVTLISGTYSPGCRDTVQFTVNVPQIPQAQFIAPTMCTGGQGVFLNTSVLDPGDTLQSYSWSFPGGTPFTSSATDPVVTYMLPDTAMATLIVTTTNGCADTVRRPVVIASGPIAAFSASPMCLGDSIQMFNQTTIVPADSVVSYSWSFPGGTPATSTAFDPWVTFGTAGNPTITLIASSTTGCVDTATSTVTVYPLPLANFSSPNICVSAPSILVDNSSAVPGDSIALYTWTIPGGSPSFSTTANPSVVFSIPDTATITLVVTNVGGCNDTIRRDIVISANPTADFAAPSVCFGDSVALTNLSINNPVGDSLIYSWSMPDATVSSSTSLAPTLYYPATGAQSVTLVATSLGGCTDTITRTLQVNPVPQALFSAPDFCTGDAQALIDLSTTDPGDAIVTYAWSIPGATPATSSQPSPLVSFSQAGQPTVTLVVSNSSGCTDSLQLPVTINPVPVVQAASINICPGMPGTLTATGATYYSWSTGATTSSITVSPVSVTTYSVTGTTLGCSSTTTATVAVSAQMTVSAGVTDTICRGGSTRLDASPAANGNIYQWTPGITLNDSTISTPLASPTTSTLYSVTVTDQNGCSGTGLVRVVVDTFPVLQAVSAPVLCNGGSDGVISAIASGGFGPYRYLWSTGCDSVSCSGVPAGVYDVMVTDAYGCRDTTQVEVMQPDPLTIFGPALSSVPCYGSCTASATVTVGGGTAPYLYGWNTPTPSYAATASGMCAGFYECLVTDNHGCTVTHYVQVDEPPPVSLTPILSQTPCAGGSTQLNAGAIGGVGGYQFHWTPPTALSATEIPDPLATPLVQTTYFVSAIDSNGCPSDTLSIAVTPAVPLALAVDTAAPVCPGISTSLSALASAGTGGPYTYSWTPAVGLNSDTLADPAVTPFATTTYTVTVNDGCSTPQTGTVTVRVYDPPIPVIHADHPDGCAPLCVTFDAGSDSSGNSLYWDFGSGSSSTELNPQRCFESSGEYAIHLTAVSPEGCAADTTVPGLVTVYENPSADFQVSTPTTEFNSPQFWFEDRSSADVAMWIWNYGDGSPLDTAGPTPNHSYAEAMPGNTYYHFDPTLVVITEHGCMDTITRPLDVGPSFTFYIPSSFTPNGDLKNNLFYGKGTGIVEYEIWIFDRWGLQLWNCQAGGPNVPWDYYGREGMASACQWDGMYGGKTVQQDVYVWKVRLTDVFGKRHSYLGRVTVYY